MGTLERWLRTRPLAISLLLALVVCCCLGSGGVVSEDIMPFGDGEPYILRGLTLYGYLHSGQWSNFWEVFTSPRQSIAPPHYWFFFLLPQAIASVTSYGVIQTATTYGLLAIGVWELCRKLDRVKWAPTLFLFCAAQNISLDESYFYFADVPFFAMGTMVLAWQVGAWRDTDWRKSLLSGAGAGMMFWVKPANAIVFAATYLLAEIFRIALVWYERKKGTDKDVDRMSVRQINHFRHAGAVAAGFIPIAFLAMACGGAQSIVRLINANEVSGAAVTTLECSGFLRFFYFPLCLTFFYHTKAMLLILAVMGLLALRMNLKKTVSSGMAISGPPLDDSLFPGSLLLPFLLAYFVLGEVFSFGMENKEMRSMLLVLPVFWLAIFWVLEYWRVQPSLIFAAAGTYVLCAYSQIFLNIFETTDVGTESYQLKDDWLARLPQVRDNPKIHIHSTNTLFKLIKDDLPDGGKVAVGSEQLYVTAGSLSWVTQHELALHGQKSRFEFENFLASDGKICRSALLHAQGILVFVTPDLQYSLKVQAVSVALVRFCAWSRLEGQVEQIFPIQEEGGPLAGFMIITKEPLNDAQITELIKRTHTTALSPAIDGAFNWHDNDRLTWPECEDILMRWKQKRLSELWSQ